MKKSGEKYLPIEDYGIIGNLQTAALVSLTGSIDFMCFMRFDSPTIFCRLLDANHGGHFSIQPLMNDMVTKQLYMPDSNILVTRFFSEEGIAEIIDYMPVNEQELNFAVIRKITTVRGKINFNMTCAPRFNYARDTHTLKQEGDQAYVFIPQTQTQPPIRLLSDVPLKGDDTDITASFTLTETATACFVLETYDNKKNRPGSLHNYVDDTYKSTIRYWQNWINQCTYDGRWREMVNRSALTLKLLISHHYGSIVAAPTFSLPEAIGHERNWDYRYTWIRDAAFSMHAFLQLGFMDEAAAFLQWIKKQSTNQELQLMFAIDGETRLDEFILDNMEGYRQSKPVRVGNDAHKQVQMDIYGELLETIYIFAVHGGDITYDYWKIISGYVNTVIENWQKPDHSIWEVRGAKREFLYSRIMCWAALDRAVKIAERFSFPYDILKWHTVRDEIYKDVYENFWSEEKQAYVQSKGSNNLDASALLMPVLNIISPFSERWKKTMDAIDKELRSDVMIYRYREQKEEIDGLKGREGTFTVCSFWHVECLALMNETEKAKEHFEKMLGYANHLGLFAEELGMKGEFLGNFPQAFTHLGLISAALQLGRETKSPIAQSDTSAQRMK
jgi:GH15 family glucan-1,4-alpha-glucosidase